MYATTTGTDATQEVTVTSEAKGVHLNYECFYGSGEYFNGTVHGSWKIAGKVINGEKVEKQTGVWVDQVPKFYAEEAPVTLAGAQAGRTSSKLEEHNHLR